MWRQRRDSYSQLCKINLLSINFDPCLGQHNIGQFYNTACLQCGHCHCTLLWECGPWSLCDVVLWYCRQYFMFMDDNEKPHRAYILYDILVEDNVRLMYRPSISPGLIPIEHVWDSLEKATAQYNLTSKTHKELKAATIIYWYHHKQKESWSWDLHSSAGWSHSILDRLFLEINALSVIPNLAFFDTPWTLIDI